MFIPRTKKLPDGDSNINKLNFLRSNGEKGGRYKHILCVFNHLVTPKLSSKYALLWAFCSVLEGTHTGSCVSDRMQVPN